MDSYAIARAESRIERLEREVRELRLEADRRKRDEMFRSNFLDDFFFPLLWIAACCLMGAGIGTVIGKILRLH